MYNQFLEISRIKMKMNLLVKMSTSEIETHEYSL